jgi:catechol 2,3-dioxygenase-like lactoylglutathione lyase family enzyme
MKRAHFIFYVRDQDASSRFYSETLSIEPRLHVPGMTEFELPGGARLGLMPEADIKSLLGDSLPDPKTASGIPRAELYLYVEDPAVYHERALGTGARELSPLLPRGWGDEAAYSIDPDGHVVAFAAPIEGAEEDSA